MPSKAVFAVVPALLAVGLQRINPEQFPIDKVVRNVFLPPTPETLKPIHGKCTDEELASQVTVVISVKDSCSQAPGFLDHLARTVPRGVHVIHTYPNFTSCAEIDLSSQAKHWDHFEKVPLNIHSSPMVGWLDSVTKNWVKTPYTYLVHNDGYALDDHFLCELLRGLKTRQATEPEWAIAAPMLYESKHDRSFAAHATQSNVRLVRDKAEDSKYGPLTVRHDHSVRMALRRQGVDLEEGEQKEFLEDHGFLIDTDKIERVIDPNASMTMEYLDMIMSIKSNDWKVLLVPTARLEFRITEFSWRDIPYFMYKRSEITAQGTRDYLKAKWNVNFPNTGFWAFIKYTIIEKHAYDMDEIAELPLQHHLLLAFGWFQMVGWNAYDLGTAGSRLGFLDVLENVDNGWTPAAGSTIGLSRKRARPEWTETRPISKNVTDLLPEKGNPWPPMEADLPYEYFPFSAAEVVTNCSALEPALLPICGLVLDHNDGSCSCWINLPTWKTNGWLPHIIDKVAGWIKVPSRISTYWEMSKMVADAAKHTRGLKKYTAQGLGIRLTDCEADPKKLTAENEFCTYDFKFTPQTRVRRFEGQPFSPQEVKAALINFFKTQRA